MSSSDDILKNINVKKTAHFSFQTPCLHVLWVKMMLLFVQGLEREAE